jgi:hypothetical protein
VALPGSQRKRHTQRHSVQLLALLTGSDLAMADLADDDDGECEQLLSVAVDAYANVTLEDLFEKVSVPSFHARGRSWTPDDLPRLFPECFKT